MSKSYQPWTQDQLFLLPPSLREWLPEDHLAWFILEVVSQLDLSPLEDALQEKDPRGQRPYHPQMMVALLLYAYCTGVYSSRKIERATHEDVAFRVLAANTHPHFTTINEFRRQHREHFARFFVQGLELCRGAGLVKLGHVATDGSKVRANASKHKAMSYKRLRKREAALAQEVEGLLARAEAVDAEEDARYGEGVRGEELPEELRRRESRLARIREAKAALEAEARASRAQALREQAQGMEHTAASHPDPSMQQRLRSNASQRRAKADELDPPGDDPAGGGGGGGAAEALPGKRTLATPQGLPPDKAQRNFTDPQSSIMAGGEGFIQAYNAQLAVDAHCQVIVANGVTDQPADNANLLPMLHRVRANLGAYPQRASADAGYWNPESPAQAEALGVEAFIATERIAHGQAGVPSRAGAPPPGLDARARMRWRLDTPQGRALYARRKTVVEPVNGQIKGARGFQRFSSRGRCAVAAEWNLVCLCHNLLKLFRYGSARLSAVPA
ncbi:MAG: IS1182 family transposase [Gammaproteobacteria bacterium]|nr:IS1182 family transposase [Gammaproteobacteria bacterium]